MLESCEIFASVAGESSFAGRPAVFVRLSGCNLHCLWCDTLYAGGKGRASEIRHIAEKVMSFGIPLAVITGGEPLIHSGTAELAGILAGKGLEVLLETNGSRDISELPPQVRVIMDYKLPSSGQEEKMKKNNFKKLKEKDELKFVAADRADFNRALEIVEEYRPRCGEILFSSVEGELDFKTLCGWVRREMPSARVQANLHKVFDIR